MASKRNSSVAVPEVWLERVLQLSEQTQKEIDQWVDEGKPVPERITYLIGYVKSVQTILKYNRRIDD